MSFKEWTTWLNSLPWTFKWFPILIILRPVIDNLHFLKNVSPYLSPPYLIGVATPLLCIYALIKFKLPKFQNADKAFLIYSIMVLFSCLLLIFYDPFSLLSLEFTFKLSIPVYLYFFLRLLITDLRDLHGILQSFLYAGIPVAVLLLYEVLVKPIAIQESRGMERIHAGFGDVVSYGMFITFALIAASYFFFARQHVVSKSRRLGLLIPVAVLALLGLFNIHHTASYIVFVVLLAIFILFNLRVKNRGIALAIIAIAGTLLLFTGSQIISDQIAPLIETDLQVYAGDQAADKLLHGRVGRWRNMLNEFSTQSVHIQVLGYPLSFTYVFHFIGSGSHNDFVRILFTTGIVGVFAYLVVLYHFWLRRRFLATAQRYLHAVSFMALLFYSISVTPTMYAPFMYFIMAIFAYVALPQNKLTAWINRAY